MAASVGVMEAHDIPPDVLTSALHWLRRGCVTGQHDPTDLLEEFRRAAVVGAKYCYNAGCGVVGLLKEFKVCPQCKTARYCSAACQKEDWTAGGHKATCGTYTCKPPNGGQSFS